MNQIQKVEFRKIADFLDHLPEDELKIVEVLRTLVIETIPDCKEKLSYNVPFYYRHSRICFIWPASVPWGSVKKGVAIGFCKGNLLADISYFDKSDRKEIQAKVFTNVKEIDYSILKQLLYEATEIDDEINRQKTAKNINHKRRK